MFRYIFMYNFLLILYHFWLMYMNHIYMHNNIYVCGQKCGEMSLAIKRNALVAFLAQQSSESIPSTLDRRPTGHHSLVCGGWLRPRPPWKFKSIVISWKSIFECKPFASDLVLPDGSEQFDYGLSQSWLECLLRQKKCGIKIHRKGNFDPYWQRHRPHFPQVNVPEEIASENLIDGGNLPAGVVENEV